MKNVKTRFAPSPTGAMHIGGVRTALYSFLLARKHKGVFGLRIEDTDRSRFIEGSVEDIIETLKWLGLRFDGEPIFQSKNKETYQKYAKELKDKGLAYEDGGAIWFKTDKDGKTSIVDLIGERTIEFDNSTQADFVILKSDGFPTYHFAHVIDDHLWETNPVIRGAEWISSIPKHVMLFKALGFEVPKYAHLPIILGPDKSKLSKRHGARAASEFRQDGFLPEAILNFMALLGWTPKSGKEFLSLDEMAKEFDLEGVNLANSIFDITKLEWMNGEYIRRMSDDELYKRLQEFLDSFHTGTAEKETKRDEEKIRKVIPLIKERIKKLSDFIPLTDFLFDKPEYDKEIFGKLKIENNTEVLRKVLEKLEGMEKPWKAEEFEKTFRQLADEMELKAGEMFQLIRVAISGQLVTPPLFESIEILGEDETIERIKLAQSFLKDD